MPLPYEIADMCKKCILNHKKKKKEFKVSCIPVPKSMEDESDPIYPLDKIIGLKDYVQLPEPVKIDLQLEKNVLLWAKECLGWTPYNSDRKFYQWYQKEFLLCTAQNKVLRFGRRLGKCVHEDTLIRTSNRGLVKAKELTSLDELITYNEKTKEVYPTKKWYLTDNGIKKCIEVITETDKRDIVTLNHPYLVLKKNKLIWVDAEKLTTNSIVVTINEKLEKKYEKIKSLKHIEKSQTYAITVPETHTFVTNDIITHNTEGMCVEILHRAWTNNSSNKPILIIGPFQNLINEIFDRLDKMLSGKDSVYKSNYSRKRQPAEITLSNGIKIKGFTTGTDGNSIRGQSAQAVYLDECAYIPVEAFKAIMAFKLDNPNVIFRAASTPSMIETNFKTWCTEDKSWHEAYCPSTVLPNFKEKDEPELRASLTADGYQLEVEAKFIEGSARVFKSHNINNAKSKYRYINSRDELENPNDWYITIGEINQRRLYSLVAQECGL